MVNKIDKFRGEHYYLSNFSGYPVTYEGLTFLNNEAAFQAMKVVDPEKRVQFINLSPKEAKRKGRHVKLRGDWERVKETIMYDVVKAKFTQNEQIKRKLIDTGDALLIEGNTWNDTIWGMCNGIGQNKLGKVLMKVRKELAKTI